MRWRSYKRSRKIQRAATQGSTQPQLRILVLSNRYRPDIEGGYERDCEAVVNQLRSQGHHVVVLTRPSGRPSTDGAYRCLPDLNDKPLFKVLLQLPWGVARTLFISWRTSPSLIYVWNASGLPEGLIWSVSIVTRAPLVLFVAHYWLQDRIQQGRGLNRLARRIPRKLIRPIPRFMGRCRLVQFDSHFLQASTAMQTRHIRQEVVHHGLDPIAFAAYRAPAHRHANFRSQNLLLFVGRVAQEKGVLTAVRAVALARAESSVDFKLAIAGPDGGALAEVKALVRRLHLEDSTLLLGHLDQVALRHWYERAGVMLFLSQYNEPFGMSLAEAAAAGLPAISTMAGGAGEVLRSNECMPIPMKNPGAAARAIMLLHSNPILYGEIAARARQRSLALQRDIISARIEQQLLAVTRQ